MDMIRCGSRFASGSIGLLCAISLVSGVTSCRNPASPLPSAPPGTVRCPRVSLEVSSFDSEIGTSINVSAGAAESGAGGPVTYSWTAGGGRFDNPSAAATAYSCPRSGGAGPQIISVSASRGPCTVNQQVVVVCLEQSVDAGLGGSPDEGGLGGAGGESGKGDAAVDGGDAAGGEAACGIDPTIDEGNACNQCTNSNCTTLENAKPHVTVTDGCHQLASEAQRLSCQALYCCIRSSRCVVDGDPTACWCGSADPTNCALGTELANGPCVKEIAQAAGTAQPSQIALRMIDPTFPVGGAVNLATCRATFCASPPTPACAGF